MWLTNLAIKNFRNLESLDLKTHQGFVVLTGPNGAGKTNFLEAIYYGCTLQKFPESKIQQLFQDQSNFFNIKLSYQTEELGEPQFLEVILEQKEERYSYLAKHNHQLIARGRYAGLLPEISFLPQDLHLLTRSPAARRRFLNDTLVFNSAQYRFALDQYEKALRQRNDLWQKIKFQGADPKEMEIWDEKLAEFGSELTKSRQTFIDYLNQRSKAVLEILSPELAHIKFSYQTTGAGNKQEFLKKILMMRAKEQELGTTSLGPHRDDFKATLGGNDVVGYISRGQLRSITLALKILEKNYLEENLNLSPIMILDDVFSEFDQNHQRKLIDFLKTLKQVFLTTTHLEEFKNFLPPQIQNLNIKDGILSPNV